MGESFLKRLFKPKEQKVEPAAAPTSAELAKLDSEVDASELATDPMEKLNSQLNQDEIPTDTTGIVKAWQEDPVAAQFFVQGEAEYTENGMLPTYNPVVYEETQKQPSRFSSWLNRGFDTVAKRVNSLFSDKEGNLHETRVNVASFSFGTIGAMAMAAMLSQQMEGFQKNVEDYLNAVGPTAVMQADMQAEK